MVRRKGDIRNDIRCGFEILTARAIDKIGVDGIIDTLKRRVKGSRVYISVDIDVLDPAFAPGKRNNTILLFLHLEPDIPHAVWLDPGLARRSHGCLLCNLIGLVPRKSLANSRADSNRDG